METALIVSYSDQGIESIANLLKKVSCRKISTAKTCGEARRLALENCFDLYIINSPVYTESGEDLAKEFIMNDTSQVLFIVKNDVYDYMSNLVEDLGVITISKPLNKNTLWTALKLAKATNARLGKMRTQNINLTRKIDEIKIVDRAKCILISNLDMTEVQAHKYIEKKAMDTRESRRDVAQSIIKTYEN